MLGLCIFNLFSFNIFQMRAIKEELGDNDDDEDDVAALERKMQSAGMPSNIWKHAQRELRYDLLQNVDEEDCIPLTSGKQIVRNTSS